MKVRVLVRRLGETEVLPVHRQGCEPVLRHSDRRLDERHILGFFISRRPLTPQQGYHTGTGTLWQPRQLEVDEVPAAQNLPRYLREQQQLIRRPPPRLVRRER